ncbi:MAG: toll/interleukin-1 receptor domain-containing protein [Leptolyngbya sp. UWPOB_LEPTO1]|uniref:toll/interleukin-1 receptor domain-containing protein n=1 Tax=Leptolyngbya sp. UWPOB_LEPTO1 TaxID=2815653 RepID=UPI001ACF2406|nr:toll/interleukin-1 receptor domain-containing protein [Leptolyngbya sp. UWPOB_LEPTO1]MBN8561084.1 toll/interleukin-1 receptor domain-containing protein [Leptolyngbya sp. UWPOB_LEPTO1]
MFFTQGSWSFYYHLNDELEFKLFKLLMAAESAIEEESNLVDAPKSWLRALYHCRICCILDNGFDLQSCKCNDGEFSIHVVLTEKGVEPKVNALFVHSVNEKIDARGALHTVFSEINKRGLLGALPPFPSDSFAFSIPGRYLDDWRYDERMGFLKKMAAEYIRYEIDRVRQLRGIPRMYDVCLSYASDALEFVNSVASYLSENGIEVFFDRFLQNEIWGEDLYVLLEDVYRERSKYCLLFISDAYGERYWTNRELRSALERERRSSQPYILPVLLTDNRVNIPGLELSSRVWFKGHDIGAACLAQEVLNRLTN